MLHFLSTSMFWKFIIATPYIYIASFSKSSLKTYFKLFTQKYYAEFKWTFYVFWTSDQQDCPTFHSWVWLGGFMSSQANLHNPMLYSKSSFWENNKQAKETKNTHWNCPWKNNRKRVKDQRVNKLLFPWGNIKLKVRSVWNHQTCHMAFIAAIIAPIKPTLKAMKTFLLETDRALIRSSLITFCW